MHLKLDPNQRADIGTLLPGSTHLQPPPQPSSAHEGTLIPNKHMLPFQLLRDCQLWMAPCRPAHLSHVKCVTDGPLPLAPGSHGLTNGSLSPSVELCERLSPHEQSHVEIRRPPAPPPPCTACRRSADVSLVHPAIIFPLFFLPHPIIPSDIGTGE